MLRFAKGILEDVREVSCAIGFPLKVRIGINSGELVAGVIGKTKFIYDVWGDTVNIASRMESTAEPMTIHVSEATYNRLKANHSYKEKSQVQVKGKGLMDSYIM
jgi:class 3 adenylate cyclase